MILRYLVLLCTLFTFTLVLSMVQAQVTSTATKTDLMYVFVGQITTEAGQYNARLNLHRQYTALLVEKNGEWHTFSNIEVTSSDVENEFQFAFKDGTSTVCITLRFFDTGRAIGEFESKTPDDFGTAIWTDGIAYFIDSARLRRQSQPY